MGIKCNALVCKIQDKKGKEKIKKIYPPSDCETAVTHKAEITFLDASKN